MSDPSSPQGSDRSGSASQPTPLHEALTNLETALLTPVVSGELAPWVRDVREAAARAGDELKNYLGSTQRRQYREMAKADPELLSRIEQLADDDRTLLGKLAQFEKNAAKLEELVNADRRHESRSEDHRAELEQQGLALILSARKHQIATETWLSEAFYRDRGTVD
jgi:hypothetical protein